MMYNQRDIVLLPIPFTDLTSTKKRPAVIVSNDKHNQKSDDIIVVAMTSNLLKGNDTAIMLENEDLDNGILPLPSQIIAEKIFTIQKRLVVKKHGTVKKEILGLIRSKLSKLISSS